jgi:hypothetical protein
MKLTAIFSLLLALCICSTPSTAGQDLAAELALIKARCDALRDAALRLKQSELELRVAKETLKSEFPPQQRNTIGVLLPVYTAALAGGPHGITTVPGRPTVARVRNAELRVIRERECLLRMINGFIGQIED